jgi:D-alanyl-D-alanine carboxypeptidase
MKASLKYILVIIVLVLLTIGGILFYSWEIGEDLSSIKFLKADSLPEKKPEEKLVSLKFFEDVRRDFFLNNKSFLELHLETMKARLYKGGLLIKEVPILIKGDPQRWGGSAVGLYRILSGNKVSFSNTSDVYMPYALHYYGKYYIHGEPYYYGGEKLESSFSGGCLRLNDKDAELIYELSDLSMPVLVIDKERDHYDYLEETTKFPELSAKSYLIADLDSGHIFAEKDIQEQRPIASLTKLMTALVVAENVNLKRSILIKEEMLDAYGTTEELEVGKRFRVVELFYPLLIESSNDSAEALSYFLGKEKTLRLMNEKAQALLMTETKYTDPSGFDPGNISTAQDLFYLARYLLNNRSPILDITKKKKVTSFGPISFDIDKLWNKNVFIEDPTFIGGKTGFIIASKLTAIFLFRFADKDNNDTERNIAIILLGSDSNKKDTQRIYRWLQDNYFGQQYLLANN